MIRKLVHFIKDEEGATAVEYAIMAGLIAAVIITAVTILGQNVNTTFTQIGTAVPAGTGAGS
jgi:pilus assembly protein Flp/PilA